jgi:hypothetical protein
MKTNRKTKRKGTRRVGLQDLIKRLSAEFPQARISVENVSGEDGDLRVRARNSRTVYARAQALVINALLFNTALDAGLRQRRTNWWQFVETAPC